MRTVEEIGNTELTSESVEWSVVGWIMHAGDSFVPYSHVIPTYMLRSGEESALELAPLSPKSTLCRWCSPCNGARSSRHEVDAILLLHRPAEYGTARTKLRYWGRSSKKGACSQESFTEKLIVTKLTPSPLPPLATHEVRSEIRSQGI